ncbi:uncharacterized protein [Amphiura filiformis]|uniref:uncharacterized protein n=1 Tax=Amphiura filiformis TaxID=82378 RepID=UPI003B20BC80
MSGPLERSCQTNIAQPGEIIIREITDICVTFTWGEINLTFDNYLLQTLDEEDNSNVDTQVHDNVVITTSVDSLLASCIPFYCRLPQKHRYREENLLLQNQIQYKVSSVQD